MGNRFSRRRDVQISTGETATTEQKTAEEPAAAPPAEEPGMAPTQEVIETQNLEVVLGDPVTVVPRLPSEECVSECKEVEAPAASAALNDAEPEPAAKETPSPVSKPSTPESVPAAEPKPVAEAQLAPEPVAEPDPTSNPEEEVEAVPGLTSESVPVPAEAVEQPTDMLAHEPLPEQELSAPPLIDLGVPDVAPQPVDTPPSPAPIPDTVNADEPSDLPMTEECQDDAEGSMFEPEKSEETPEPLEKPMEVGAAGNLEQLVSDVNEGNISGLLQNLELKGNDLVTDLIPSDVKIPDETPITDVY